MGAFIGAEQQGGAYLARLDHAFGRGKSGGKIFDHNIDRPVEIVEAQGSDGDRDAAAHRHVGIARSTLSRKSGDGGRTVRR